MKKNMRKKKRRKKKENDDFEAFDRAFDHDSCYLVSAVINLAQACVVAIV